MYSLVAAVALAVLLQVVSALPNRADVLLLMGAICYQLKDYAQVCAASMAAAQTRSKAGLPAQRMKQPALAAVQQYMHLYVARQECLSAHHASLRPGAIRA